MLVEGDRETTAVSYHGEEVKKFSEEVVREIVKKELKKGGGG